MELLRGQTLDRCVATARPLSPVALESLLWPLLDGLQEIHSAGFLHRDIKPGNIIIGVDGGPKLIDFGAARLASPGRSSTMTAIFTPGFAAPEQFTATKQAPWTDIYGLAATMHLAITGKLPQRLRAVAGGWLRPASGRGAG